MSATSPSLSCNESEYALYLIGYEDDPIRDVKLVNCRFENVEKDSVIENVEDLILEDVFINGVRVT